MTKVTKLEFWNSRAKLNSIAGTNDFILKEIEMGAIFEIISEGSYVLDIGCGNGDTLIELSTRKGCTGTGIDFSEEMVKLAIDSAKKTGCSNSLRFIQDSMPEISKDLGEFDFVITERSLINLSDQPEQYAAFKEIMTHVKPGGFYLMIESFIQGLDNTNELRQKLDLEPISPPWHNVFLDEKAVEKWSNEQYVLKDTIPISSTYYFLSRVVYAKLAQDKGEELKYDSNINLLSTKLPVLGNFGPIRLFLWQRNF